MLQTGPPGILGRVDTVDEQQVHILLVVRIRSRSQGAEHSKGSPRAARAADLIA